MWIDKTEFSYSVNTKQQVKTSKILLVIILWQSLVEYLIVGLSHILYSKSIAKCLVNLPNALYNHELLTNKLLWTYLYLAI